ncbi:hypothetical protein CBR_g50339 [Chara braunii]|uniref:GST N-terminal domain-containing protein n=1 Tax=Chara braunii TaxID=69332 RepID=A0A388K5H1_CHABU|nr:hypothetical protein CBR_g50339 [Chara braunii]|eukprot:GBG65298.1 hypothetical protein CBR_g50339 [Chara braunii]
MASVGNAMGAAACRAAVSRATVLSSSSSCAPSAARSASGSVLLGTGDVACCLAQVAGDGSASRARSAAGATSGCAHATWLARRQHVQTFPPPVVSGVVRGRHENCRGGWIAEERGESVAGGGEGRGGFSVRGGTTAGRLRGGVHRDCAMRAGIRCRSSSSGASGGGKEDTTTRLMGLIAEKNAQNPVVVYSKTWCPYCAAVKGLFTKLGVEFKLVELDELVGEEDWQYALSQLTGQRTVPSVFVGGEHIGGCDSTMELHESGQLMDRLREAGASIASA